MGGDQSWICPPRNRKNCPFVAIKLGHHQKQGLLMDEFIQKSLNAAYVGFPICRVQIYQLNLNVFI